MIYPILCPSPPTTTIYPPDYEDDDNNVNDDNDDNNDDNDNDKYFGNVVLILNVAIDQYIMNYLKIPTTQMLLQKAYPPPADDG